MKENQYKTFSPIAMRKTPLVSVITVNYNGKHLLNDCFESLQNLNYPKTKIEVFMIDNGSEDDSIDYVRKNFPKVKIITNNENNYARANNLGIKAAKGEFIALINNDVKVDKNWLLALVETAQEDNSIGAVGSKILFMDGAIQSAGHQEYPNFYWEDIGFKEEDKNQYNITKEVSSICGCSVLYRKKCLGNIGLLDEDFNMFMEDVDIAIRCKKRRWRTVICPESTIYHKFHSTIKSEENAKYWQETNRLLLIAKHWPEKLPAALSGKDYFTAKNGYDSDKDISTVLGKVFVKLIKEHGLELANKLSSDLFETIRKIYNFEKEYLTEEIKNHILNIEQKDKELFTKNLQLEARDKYITEKEEELIDAHRKIISINDELENKQQELQNICDSTCFRYLVKPIWHILWPMKQILNRPKIQLRFFLFRLVKVSKVLLKIFGTEITFMFKNKTFSKSYLSHIYNHTYPIPPKKLILMLTARCNLKCSFCDIPDRNYNKKELTKEEAIKIIDSAVGLGVEQIEITGGEPLLHNDFFEIVSYASNHKLEVFCTTNGTLLMENMDKIMASSISCISVSIDGFEDTHHQLRNCHNVYAKIIKAIDFLKQNGRKVNINFVVTNKNVYELENLYNLFVKKGIGFTFFPVINKPDLYLDSNKNKKIFVGFIKKLLWKRKISYFQYRYYVNMFRYFNNYKIRVRCLGLSKEFGVDVRGNLLPCCVWSNEERPFNELGNVLTNDLEALWHSQEIYKARLEIFKNGCGGCYNPSICEFSQLIGQDFLMNKKTQRERLVFRNIPRSRLYERAPKPKHVHMRLTSRCNLACRHCDIWKAKETKTELDALQWKEIILKIYNWLGPFKLDLAGGEILLREDAIDIIRYASDKGIVVGLTTNATLIDKIMAKKIVDSGLTALNISLDGSMAETHNYIRNNQNAYHLVMNAVSYLNSVRNSKPLIVLSAVITENNLEELQDLVMLTKYGKFDSITFQALDHNFGAAYEQLWFKKNEFWPKEALRINKVIDGLIDLKLKGFRTNNSFEQLDAMKQYFTDPLQFNAEYKCTSGDKNFIIDEFGGVRLCWNIEPIGNILSQDPKSIWQSELASQKRKLTSMCNRTCRVLNCNY